MEPESRTQPLSQNVGLPVSRSRRENSQQFWGGPTRMIDKRSA
jgi:hypothetical protein